MPKSLSLHRLRFNSSRMMVSMRRPIRRLAELRPNRRCGFGGTRGAARIFISPKVRAVESGTPDEI